MSQYAVSHAVSGMVSGSTDGASSGHQVQLRLLKFKAHKDLIKMSGLLDGGRDGGRGDVGADQQ